MTATDLDYRAALLSSVCGLRRPRRPYRRTEAAGPTASDGVRRTV
ncbi:hypothetical protein [Kribbella pittospori]|nr:hypothetical protein [Kribbella pittospori]